MLFCVKLARIALILLTALGLALPGQALARANSQRRPHCSGAGVPQVALSPLNGAPAVPPGAQISFLGVPASALHEISVVGSRSGVHPGALHAYATAQGASFLPRSGFTAGERVEVHATVRFGGGCRTIASAFTVARPAQPVYEEPLEYPGTPGEMQHFESNEVKPPVLTVTQPAGAESAPGYLFATPYLGPGEHGPMIFESSGRLVWFHLLPPGLDAADFAPQSYEGQQALVWWQGSVNTLGFGLGEDVVMNDAYKVVAKIHAGNGLRADMHAIELTANGTAAILDAYEPVRIGAAAAEGQRSAPGAPSRVVLDGVVQEIDVKTGLVMWEWDSLGHVAFSASRQPPPKRRSKPFDYFHLDDVQSLSGGQLRVFARNAATVYTLNGRTGAVISRLREKEGVSRSTLGEGDSQTLSNGNELVYAPGANGFAEFDAAGNRVYEAQFPAGEASERVLREPWDGEPSGGPGIATKAAGTQTKVSVSWNGATDVSTWEVLSGLSPTSLSPVGTLSSSGFETSFSIPAEPYVEVIALDADGEILGESKIKEAVHE
ncbi:MAG TPA: arylsulfotransferase family protein [Solirubrobacteraceae bacterium]